MLPCINDAPLRDVSIESAMNSSEVCADLKKILRAKTLQALATLVWLFRPTFRMGFWADMDQEKWVPLVEVFAFHRSQCKEKPRSLSSPTPPSTMGRAATHCAEHFTHTHTHTVI